MTANDNAVGSKIRKKYSNLICFRITNANVVTTRAGRCATIAARCSTRSAGGPASSSRPTSASDASVSDTQTNASLILRSLI